MKKILILLAMAAGLSSCDKDFESINTNPTQSTNIDPVYLFSNAQLNTTLASQTMFYEAAIVQQVNTPFGGVNTGANLNQDYRDNSRVNWLYLYSGTNNGNNGPIKLLTAVLDQTKADSSRTNLYHMSRIWRAYVFQVLVDTYGDVPYFDAGKAYISGNKLPKYDPQAEIYTDLAKELEGAIAGLNAAKRIEAGDLFYQGNVAKWKRLGYSLLLRIGMRYSKTDPAKAQALAQKAYQGGVLQSNDDNVRIQYSSIYTNPLGNLWNNTEKANLYVGAPFVSYLKSTNDPRLTVIAVRYGEPSKNPEQTTVDRTFANQIGMPFGYDDGSIGTAPNFPGKVASGGWNYSQINRRTVGKVDGPTYYVTYAQTQLLLAEAAQRGWIQASAADLYKAGVTAHMNQMKDYDASATIAQTAIDAYLAAQPYNAAQGLEQINSQYWVASFLNGPEAFANWRRSGFPVLSPNKYPGRTITGDFIRRLTYPILEQSVNAENYNAAVSRQGPDNLETRVFWDKP
ncbi:SusD/RagB family nutrient-binding outer membrane lipoprotein [Siphonobacter sp. BAB-5385]|uniref:SusD/RagB family nutrient-binding outer membrane lipoprotein n=1 Tax=Siphonobacter sp. BAB-5385 TaxID=1864822 RepID=UPI000B9E9F41|nr:SusD/RagB family nutrient-binding outer membrane lipoprotein [Siphonobacter sp. BAB-5385]OZI06141.1 SusD/RagB family nutrient-binding outer membrane lipoprotein [Siphonobacter sp. BAB-5385]